MDVLAVGVRVLFKGFVLGLVLFAIGFIVFANAVGGDQGQARATVAAEGIVVFTGGHERVAVATKLLAEGKGRRLLITGVHPATTAEGLQQRVAADAELFACCIDLDRHAQNTMDNAVQTRTWTERHGFSSLIVVTSSYHMPRTLAELERNMSDVALIPHAVVPRDHRFDAWWEDRNAARLLLVEYVKYIPALALLSAARLARKMGANEAAPTAIALD